MTLALAIIIVVKDADSFGPAISDALQPRPDSGITRENHPFELSLEKYGITDRIESVDLIQFIDAHGSPQSTCLCSYHEHQSAPHISRVRRENKKTKVPQSYRLIALQICSQILLPAAAEMDWSTLSAEILEEIVRKLDSVVEFIRFRAICSWWRSTTSPADLPPQLPWLLLPYYAGTKYRPFLCLSIGLVRVLRLPEIQDKRICGSVHGWLILFDDETTSFTLINLLTGSTISLPPTGIPGRRLVFAVLSANPTSPSGCIVALSGAVTTPTINFCWLWLGGSSDWRKLQMRVGYWVMSIAYHRSKLCVTDCDDSLLIWETTPQRKLTPATFSLELPSFGEDWTLEHCQIVDSSEELLLVVVYGNHHSTDTSSFVYGFDSENHQINMLCLKASTTGFICFTIIFWSLFPLVYMWHAEKTCILGDAA